MALPNRLKSARMDNSTSGNLIDDRVGDLEKALCDLLGVPIDTDITVPLAAVVAGGLVSLFIRNGGSDPTVQGEMRLNGSILKYHDGTASRTIGRHLFDALNYAAVNFQSDVSTGSTSYVTFVGLTANLTTNGGQVLVIFAGPANASNTSAFFTIAQDGVDGNQLAVIQQDGVQNLQTAFMALFSPAAGTHSYALRGKVSGDGGILTTNFGSAANGLLIAIELLV